MGHLLRWCSCGRLHRSPAAEKYHTKVSLLPATVICAQLEHSSSAKTKQTSTISKYSLATKYGSLSQAFYPWDFCKLPPQPFSDLANLVEESLPIISLQDAIERFLSDSEK